MSTLPLGARDSLGQTERQDAWWIEPTLIVIAIVLFMAYGMYTSFQPLDHYLFGPYVSPFRSPILHFFDIPAGLHPLLAQLIILIPLVIPFGFRATCYYFRKAYYRSMIFSPPACAVGKAGAESYQGEKSFPLIFQNSHRYFMYAAIGLVILHWIDTVHAFQHNGALYIGLGTILLLLDAVFLSLYVFSCHAWRHLVGGKLDCYSCDKMSEVRHTGWKRITMLNEKHALFAWVSMGSIVLADLYIRLLSSGVIAKDIIFVGH
jgi:hypothetical protein